MPVRVEENPHGNRTEPFGKKLRQIRRALGGAAVDHQQTIGARQNDDVAAGAVDLNQSVAQLDNGKGSCAGLRVRGSRAAESREHRTGPADRLQETPAAADCVWLTHSTNRPPKLVVLGISSSSTIRCGNDGRPRLGIARSRHFATIVIKFPEGNASLGDAARGLGKRIYVSRAKPFVRACATTASRSRPSDCVSRPRPIRSDSSFATYSVGLLGHWSSDVSRLVVRSVRPAGQIVVHGQVHGEEHVLLPDGLAKG